MDCQSNSPKYTEENQMAAAGCAHNVPRKRLYTIKELVVEIGATEWFWRSQIWDGQLPYVQVGRKMFIDSIDIERFIETHKMSN
ncbi:hypothetical protein [Desulfovulcanus sp.]